MAIPERRFRWRELGFVDGICQSRKGRRRDEVSSSIGEGTVQFHWSVGGVSGVVLGSTYEPLASRLGSSPPELDVSLKLVVSALRRRKWRTSSSREMEYCDLIGMIF